MTIDDENLAKAVQASLEDNLERTCSGERISTNTNSEPTDGPPRYTIEDCIRDLYTNQELRTPSIYDVEGDTFIFVDPPPKQPEQSFQSYEQYKCRYSKPFLMKREKLSKASPVLKEKLDSPDYRFRTLRRRGLAAKGKLPENVRYVLDLTPATEGEEAVYLTASLSCSEGIRYWHEAGKIWNISDRLVGGKEEYSLVQRAHPSPKNASPLEYSPIRHRLAIERVLAGIQGIDVIFDSAVKVWTTAVVAQSLGMTYDSCPYLTDSLLTWMRVEPNHHFLEINTEISLRIADGLQNQDLARDAFALLVGEEALDSLYRNRTLIKDKYISTFGRKKDDLPEALTERVEYASKSFIERSIAEFQILIGNEMQWLEELPTVKRLTALDEPTFQDITGKLKKTLKAFVRNQILNIICNDTAISGRRWQKSLTFEGTEVVGLNTKEGEGEILLPRKNPKQVHGHLLPTERLFTRTFWTSLRDTTTFDHYRITEVPKTRLDDLRSLGLPDHDPLICGFIMNQDLEIRVSKLEKLAAQGQCLLNQIESITAQEDLTIPRFSCERNMASANYLRPIRPKQTDSIENVLGPTQPILAPSVPSSDDFYVEVESPHKNEINSNTILENRQPNARPINIPIRPKLPLADGLPKRPENTVPSHDLVDTPINSNIHESPVIGSKQPTSEPHEDSNDGIHDPQSDKWLPDQIYNHDVELPETSENHIANDSFPPGEQPFDVRDLLIDVGDYLQRLARKKLAPSDFLIRQDPFRPGVINTLTCLTEAEWKYLPLWAGGLDDGTGAVFSDEIMETEPDVAFSTAGPKIHTGSSTYSSSEYDMLSDADTNSTFNTSTAVADGYSDQMHRHLTYATSSMGGDDDSLFDITREEEVEAAQKQIEAFERREAAEAEAKQHELGMNVDVFDDMFYSEDEADEMDSDSDLTEMGDDFEIVENE